MLRLLAAAAALVIASCGDSDDDGAGAPTPAAGVSGTVLGQAFTAADASALVLSRATCDFVGTSLSATGIAIGFGSFQGLCPLVTQNQGCGLKANATIVTVLLARVNVVGGDAGPVRPGTYAISTTPAADGEGHVAVAQAVATRTDQACATPAGTPTASSGTVRIDSVGANITGSVDLTFPDGGRVTGTFSAPACGFQTDVCTALAGGSCPAPPACVP